MEKAYVGMMGGYAVLKDGDEKHKASHIVLTIDEYNTLIQEKMSLKTQLEEEKEAHKNDVAAEQRRSKAARNEIVKKANEAIEKANEQVKKAEKERDDALSLNVNLKRICKERANAKRGLQPKKEHHGYRFSGKIMQTKVISGHDKKEGALYTDVWTATLETPYDGTIPIHQIEDQIFSDLMGEDGILKKLYINSFTWKDNPHRIWKGTYTEAIDGADANKNYLFDYKFMVNPKSRLWEIQITTTKSIRALAEMMG